MKIQALALILYKNNIQQEFDSFKTIRRLDRVNPL